MYPFRAVIVGGSDTERTTIRREATNLSVLVDREFDDIDKVIGQRPLLADSKCFFLVKVNSSANMDQLARLSQVFMGKPIVAILNEDSDLSAVVQIQRAGAAQVVMIPFHSEQLRTALDAVMRQFGCPTTSSKVIAVLGANEGCGSTTMAINLSDAIANSLNMSCILVELSVRLGRFGNILNIEPTVTVSDLLAADNSMDVNAVNQALIRQTDRFHVAACSCRTVDHRPFLAARVAPLIGSVRQMAEVVILDMPYTLDDLFFEALSVADQVVLVAQPNPPSIRALKVISEAVAQKALGTTQHLLINRFSPKAEEFTEAQLCAAIGVERIWTVADDPEAFKTAVNKGRPLHHVSPKSPAWSGIIALAAKLIGLVETTHPKPAPIWPAWATGLFRKKASVKKTTPAVDLALHPVPDSHY